MHISNSATCALYSLGSTTGIVIDIGEELTTITPVYEGFVMQKAVKRIPIAGRDCTTYLGKKLSSKGEEIDFESLRNLKEKMSFVSVIEEETKESEYKLNDGRSIKLSSERFECMEPLFSPSLLGDESKEVEGRKKLPLSVN